MKLNIFSTFYFIPPRPPDIVSGIDFILQFISYVLSAKKYNMNPKILIFKPNITLKTELIGFITGVYSYKYSNEISKEISNISLIDFIRMINRTFSWASFIEYKKPIRGVALPKKITSASLEFFGPAYLSALGKTGLYTHLDVVFTKNIIYVPFGSAKVKGGFIKMRAHSKYSLTKNRSRRNHYKYFKWSSVVLTFAVFLSNNSRKKIMSVYKSHETDLKHLSEAALINKYRNRYEYFREENRTPITFPSRLSGPFSYRWWDQDPGEAAIIHYDSFFKENKNGIRKMKRHFPEELSLLW